MGILSEASVQNLSVPACEIDPDDMDLVREEDLSWWKSLSLGDCMALEEADIAFHLSSFIYFVMGEGLSVEDAAKRISRHFPSYYMSLDSRVDEGSALTGGDVKLPYVLKDRVNLAAISGAIDLQGLALGLGSSVNALVRQAIRTGRM